MSPGPGKSVEEKQNWANSGAENAWDGLLTGFQLLILDWNIRWSNSISSY